MTPTFFPSRDKLRAWLEKHHAKKSELWVGFYKKKSGRPSITYQEAVEEALCFGWIDGIVKRIDEHAHMQRYSPRKPKSYWSLVNTRRANELIRQNRMTAAGLAAFERRDAAATARYSFERAEARFSAADLKQFRAHQKAWSFFQAQPPGYRRVAAFFVVSAKKEETRARRLARLIADSAKGRRIGLLATNKDS